MLLTKCRNWITNWNESRTWCQKDLLADAAFLAKQRPKKKTRKGFAGKDAYIKQKPTCVFPKTIGYKKLYFEIFRAVWWEREIKILEIKILEKYGTMQGLCIFTPNYFDVVLFNNEKRPEWLWPAAAFRIRALHFLVLLLLLTKMMTLNQDHGHMKAKSRGSVQKQFYL